MTEDHNTDSFGILSLAGGILNPCWLPSPSLSLIKSWCYGTLIYVVVAVIVVQFLWDPIPGSGGVFGPMTSQILGSMVLLLLLIVACNCKNVFIRVSLVTTKQKKLILASRIFLVPVQNLSKNKVCSNNGMTI